MLLGIILLLQLFNLQIINGSTYRETSNTRLSRDSTLYAARGSIYDRNGNTLATTQMTFSLEMYKTKLENNVLNETILQVINTLESNGDSYIDTFPIKINPFEFDFSSDERKNTWLEKYEFEKTATPEEIFYKFKDKYDIQKEDIGDIRKIITVRYRISSEGYGVAKSLTISNSISRTSALIFDEQNEKYPGIDVVTNSIRAYPYGKLASHLLGYVGSISSSQYEENKDLGYTMNDLYGQDGVEFVFENYLKGKNGIKQIDMSVDGETVDEITTEDAVSGSSVVLTIDAGLQSVAEKALETAVTNPKAFTEKGGNPTAGAIVAMNAKTGEVLAMASYPSYDQGAWVGGKIDADVWNSYNTNSGRPLINRAIAGTYAPGSTFKMVTAVTALQTGNVTTKEKVNDTGVYPRGHNPKCWIYDLHHRGHGYLNITSAIKQSCNYFFYEMGYRVGIDNLDKYAKAFGLSEKTGIELTGEQAGSVASPANLEARGTGETWTVGYTLSAAIGQEGHAFTPIQMAKYIAILANGGKQINPTIVKTIIKADGTEVDRKEIQSSVDTRIGREENQNPDIDISEENLKAILEGMRGVTSETSGTAYSVFRNFNIEVAGKTGTAETQKRNKYIICRICTI